MDRMHDFCAEICAETQKPGRIPVFSLFLQEIKQLLVSMT